MGEVYRARDTKLRRDVALKVLPDAFAADAERRARFARAHAIVPWRLWAACGHATREGRYEGVDTSLGPEEAKGKPDDEGTDTRAFGGAGQTRTPGYPSACRSAEQANAKAAYKRTD